MSENTQPRRAHQFRLNLGADSIKELVHSLNQIALDIEIAGQPSANCASGGYDSGYTYEYTHDPDMTHDVYIEALNAWLAADRAQPAVVIGDDEDGQHD